MTDLAVVFLTGLTTGGISCLSVQGGMLVGSIAHQSACTLHQECEPAPSAGLRRSNQLPHVRRARPIMLFLGSKLIVYTIFGLALGWAGSVLRMTSAMQAIIQCAIGIFLLGTALRLWNVHPIFRIFEIKLPAVLHRVLRRPVQDTVHPVTTPIVLGACTLFVPCGVTQAMLVVAMGSGDPLLGAAIMAAFTLGTSPLFFTLAYMAIGLGSIREAQFIKVAAALILILGLLTIQGGLNLLGAPLPFVGLAQAAIAPPASGAADASITIAVDNNGYTPAEVRATIGRPVRLNLITEHTDGCSRTFVIPALDIQQLLPATGTTTIDLPAQHAGTIIFTCAMGMYRGQIHFEARSP